MKTAQRITLTEGWSIDLDPYNKGVPEQWFLRGPSKMARIAIVPGIIQQVYPQYHGVVWYWLIFTPSIAPDPAEKCSVQFGAVDYYAEVWLNGQYLGHHEGGETPFDLDCTASLNAGSENMLAVRVINPTNEPIDGFVLNETPHYCKTIPYGVGAAYNHGGITQPVHMSIHPPVALTDVFAQTDWASGMISLSISLENQTNKAENAILSAKASQHKSSYCAVEAFHTSNVLIKPGKISVKMELKVAQLRLWSPEDPFLYRITVCLEIKDDNSTGFMQEFIIHCGFRDFRLDEDGFFQLNGNRIFLKSSHTANHFPIGQNVAPTPDLLKRDLLYAKTAGFNMIRFIANMPHPEQLNYCDEIGLMVYEENYAGWMLEDSPHMKERFDSSLKGMILRDRNHPCVVVWGLMNESKNNPVFQHAVTTLPLVRNLDNTRLVLLNSGRWDGEHSIGSASNPQTPYWQHVWGGERNDAPTVPFSSMRWSDPGGARGGYMPDAGDAHLYPHVPQEQIIIDFIRTMGSDGQIVFLSEYGIGSLVNAIRVTRRFEQEGASAELEDAALYRSYEELYKADWLKYKMANVYPFPEDMLIESQKLNARWRLEGLNAIRANPQICGYNLSGTVDQVMAGEGLWTTWRELKPGMIDALQDGLAPLRWCMFVTPMHAYSGRPFQIEAVLANEGILKPGTYPSSFKIFGPEGVVWERTIDVVIPEADQDGRQLLAVPAMKAEVEVEGPAGTYCFAASMDKGGAPAGGRLDFYLSETSNKPSDLLEVSLLGIRQEVKEWLSFQGIRCQEYQTNHENKAKIILIGDPGALSFTDLDWMELYKCIEEGAAAIFLQPSAFLKGEDKAGWLPFTQKGKCEPFLNWLYHREDVAKKHPVFQGLPSGGILDWSYYGQIIPYVLFEGQPTPDEVIAAGFAVGYTTRDPEGYKSGVVLGSYNHGAGKFFINTLRLLENLDQNPAADRLILNLIQYCREHRN